MSFPDAAACAAHRRSAERVPDAELQHVLLYALRKLLNDCAGRDPALYVRVFYQVTTAALADH